MSEASIGNSTERVAVGWTVLIRMSNRGTTDVSSVWGAYAHNQAPTEEIKQLACELLDGDVADNTSGATHFYSPRSMPEVGESTEGMEKNPARQNYN